MRRKNWEPKADDWVYNMRTGDTGCVRSVQNGRVKMVVPRPEWPFPTWVVCDIDVLIPAKMPKPPKIDPMKELGEALL